jgi:hypothetical protein
MSGKSCQEIFVAIQSYLDRWPSLSNKVEVTL